MIYSEPLINQVSSFLTSVGFGFIVCFLYMAVKLLFRLVSSKKWAVMTGDAAFVLLASFASFFFMVISNNGIVRLNLITGQAFGGAVMYLTFGRYALKYLFKLCDVLHIVAANLLYPVRVYFMAFFNVAERIFSAVGRIISKRKEKTEGEPRKFKNIAKIHLKSENK